MYLRSIQLERFRNHGRTHLEFGGGVNVLHGKNGQGKTNILEAISCLCLTKSFYAASDATLVQFGQSGFNVEGVLCDDAGKEQSVSVTYLQASGAKAVAVNGMPVERLSSVIGMFPVVILAPESNAITFGGPSDRRRFLDLVLSQLSRAYFEDILEYRRILRQRNRMLSEASQGRTIREDVLDPWDRNLAAYGARIVLRRAQFLHDFTGYMLPAYEALVAGREEPGIEYATEPAVESHETIVEVGGRLLEKLKESRPEECERGVSLVGPHRDDMVFRINGTDLRKYASQGQHKTFLIALKTAEFAYLKDKREETPILLFDEVMNELDKERSQRLLGSAVHLGQTIVTTTDEVTSRDTLPLDAEARRFIVEEGTCRSVTSDAVKEAAVRA